MAEQPKSIWATVPPLIEAHIEYYERSVETFGTYAAALAWEVAVVSPGFLGLLWNVEALSKRSYLIPEHFRFMFLLCQLTFLAAIVLALAIYGFVVNRQNSSRGMAQQLQIAKLVTAYKNAEQPVPEGLKKQMRLDVDLMGDLVLADKREPIPRVVNLLMNFYPCLATAGYIFVGILLCTLR